MTIVTQDHHILTQANTKNSVHGEIFGQLKAGGYFEWDSPLVTVALPTKLDDAANLGLPAHTGSHVQSYAVKQKAVSNKPLFLTSLANFRLKISCITKFVLQRFFLQHYKYHSILNKQ